MSSDIKYRSAIPEGETESIDIENVSEETRYKKYYCLGCKELLIPVLGNERQRHFRHHKDCECNPNVYLHNLAETKIKARFYDKTRPFNIRLPKKFFCSAHCDLFNKDICQEDGLSEVMNLHDYYDSCIPEQREYIDDRKSYYIPDLKLIHSKHPDRDPIFIEIFVTHENTEAKRHSGYRIIEFNINPIIAVGEQDIERICSMEVIEPFSKEISLGEYEWKIRFDGFKVKDGEKQLNKQEVTIAQLYYSGKYRYTSKYCYPLHKYPSNNNAKPIYEFRIQVDEGIDSSLFYGMIYFHLVNKGYVVAKKCDFCFFLDCDSFGLNFCKRYKTKGTPHYPYGDEATYCPYFSYDNDFKQRCIEESKKFSFITIFENTQQGKETALSKMSESEKKAKWEEKLKGAQKRLEYLTSTNVDNPNGPNLTNRRYL